MNLNPISKRSMLMHLLQHKTEDQRHFSEILGLAFPIQFATDHNEFVIPKNWSIGNILECIQLVSVCIALLPKHRQT
jgi:hypothetical protein